MTIASVHELTKIYGKRGSTLRVEALRTVSIDFQKGESLAICGQSGSGKSTLMHLLGCLDRPTAGRYVLGGVDVAALDDDALADIRGRYIGFVFQSFNLIAQLTVLENLEVPLFYQGCPCHLRHRTAMKVVERVDLGDRAHHRPSELSGGEQQRAAIGRALVSDPLLVLADEPTGNLDSATGEMILAIFDDLQSEGRTIIMVTHEQRIASHCDRVIALRDGAVVSDIRGCAEAGVSNSPSGRTPVD